MTCSGTFSYLSFDLTCAARGPFHADNTSIWTVLVTIDLLLLWVFVFSRPYVLRLGFVLDSSIVLAEFRIPFFLSMTLFFFFSLISLNANCIPVYNSLYVFKIITWMSSSNLSKHSSRCNG